MGSLMLSTWSFGKVANDAGWPILTGSQHRPGDALDAVVAAATAVERDPSVDSVGVGGLPDASGRVSLDACVMTSPDRCGSVCFLRGYSDAAAIARRVMEKTVHVMLAGDGAEAFAALEGFPRRPDALLTPAARAAWEAWDALRRRSGTEGESGYLPPMNVEERYRTALAPAGEGTHDTVCILARDAAGQLAGACSTSGLAFKVPGRVGDSPIVGHGLYCDQSAGAAAATGNGELIMGVCGSFLVVELMRQGREPLEAILDVLRRIVRTYALRPEHQVGLIAVRADGRWTSGSLRAGFRHCITDQAGTRLEPAQHVELSEPNPTTK